MNITHKQRADAIRYLTDDASSAEGVAKRLKIALHEAEGLEITLVGEDLLAKAPGFYQHPRFYMSDVGLAYLALCGGGAIDSQQGLDRIKKTADLFAGTRLTVYHALMTLVQRDYAVTDDGGATFRLAD